MIPVFLYAMFLIYCDKHDCTESMKDKLATEITVNVHTGKEKKIKFIVLTTCHRMGPRD